MYSKAMKPKSRGRIVTTTRKKLEKRLILWCRRQWENNKKITRGIMFRRALFLDPNHCGGLQNPKIMPTLKSWFYNGFKKRCKLSRRSVSSTGQKLPKNWEEKVQSIVGRVAHSQMPLQRVDGTFRSGVTDNNMGNTDQLPVWMEPHSKWQWGERENHNRRMISTAGKDKERITVQLTIFKNGRKVSPYVPLVIDLIFYCSLILLLSIILLKAKPMIIFKAAPKKPGAQCGRKGTVTYEIFNKLKDKWNNSYPDRSKCYITVSRTANSSGDLTLEYLDEVFLPEVGVVDGCLPEPSSLVLDAFRGHSDKKVKAVTEPMENLDWHMMDGGITPKAQPLDVMVNKIFKGLFRDMFEEWSLNAPIHPKSGHPLPPSRQLLAQWVVMAWEKVPEELVRKAWVVSGYTSMKDLQEKATSRELVQYSSEQLGSMVENIAGADAMMAWIDEANDTEPEFPEEEDDEMSEDEEDEEDEEVEEVEDLDIEESEDEKDDNDEEEESSSRANDLIQEYLDSSSEESEDEPPRKCAGRGYALRNGMRRHIKPC